MLIENSFNILLSTKVNNDLICNIMIDIRIIHNYNPLKLFIIMVMSYCHGLKKWSVPHNHDWANTGCSGKIVIFSQFTATPPSPTSL